MKYNVKQFKANDEAYRLNLILIAIANELVEIRKKLK